MAMEKPIVVALFVATLLATMSIPTATAENIKTEDICSKNPATKVGFWGGNEGTVKDVPESQIPKGLTSVMIISNYSINAIEFTYTDQAGQSHSAGRWGGLGGTAHTLTLGSSEHVREISGTYKMFDGETCLTSFKLLTNTRTWGPWAVEEGKPFSFTAPTGTSIVGFFARGGRYLDAIGVYLNKL